MRPPPKPLDLSTVRTKLGRARLSLNRNRPQIERVAFDSKMGWKCFVHYTGWNKKYDKWVACSAVRAFDETAKVVKPPANGTDNRDGEDKAKVSLRDRPLHLSARRIR